MPGHYYVHLLFLCFVNNVELTNFEIDIVLLDINIRIRLVEQPDFCLQSIEYISSARTKTKVNPGKKKNPPRINLN